MKGNPNRRIDFADLIKGVCIIFVVIAHVEGTFEQLGTNSMLSSFHMLLYFFISGVFFKIIQRTVQIHPAKNKQIDYSFSFFYLSVFLMKYIVWKIAPRIFQLPVSWKNDTTMVA